MEDVAWASPVLPLPDDPAWAEVVAQRFGKAEGCYLYAAPSHWLREGLVDTVQQEFRELPMDLALLVILVTSQENACRYCYGSARQYLALQGISERRIDEVERNVKLASADEKEFAVLEFARDLSRSSPRPSRDAANALKQLGYSEPAVEEIALAVVSACFTNRFATFAAVPLQQETAQPSFMQRWVSPLLTRVFRKPRPVQSASRKPDAAGPYAPLVDLVADTRGASVLARMLQGATSSSVLPRRTVGWMFAVVARALDCKLCGEGSKRLLLSEGIQEERIEDVLHSLAGPELDQTESILLPWVRETVHYQTEVIQRRNHELKKLVDARVLLEAFGVAALANACARLSMLEQ